MDGSKTPAGVLRQNQVLNASRPQFPCCAWHNTTCGGHRGHKADAPPGRCSNGDGTGTGEVTPDREHSSAVWTETGTRGGCQDKDVLRAGGAQQVKAGGFDSKYKGPVAGSA